MSCTNRSYCQARTYVPFVKEGGAHAGASATPRIPSYLGFEDVNERLTLPLAIAKAAHKG